MDDTAGNFGIHYKQSVDGGLLWKTKRLTYMSGDSLLPAIVIDPLDRVHVAWGDQWPGNDEIYYKKGIQ